MEEFSQSRGDDDLFDDEIIPIEQSTPAQEVTQHLEQISLEPPPGPTQPLPPADQSPQSTPSQHSNRGRGRGRGPSQHLLRGGVRGGAPRQQGAYTARGAHNLSDLKWSTKPSQQPAPTVTPAAPEQQAEETIPTPPNDTDAAASSSPANAPPSAPTGPAAKPRPQAVRGDRSSTGGFAKPKLTEEELSAKLAAAKEKSVGLAAAHARAQADADEFAERERMAGARRRKEEGERKQMEGEREKNRARKMGAREGREWDRDKEELAAGRGFTPRARDADEEQQDLSIYEWNDDRGGGRGRGGRGRGRGRGGRGGARGGVGPFSGRESQREPHVNAPDEFPALPGSGTAKDSKPTPEGDKSQKPPPPARVDSDRAAAGKSWADQMEA